MPILAVVTIATSAATVGFTSATISYDFDVDPAKRKIDSAFYGYIRDGGIARLISFSCLIVNSTLLLLLRSISAALVITVSNHLFWGYLGIDMFLYLLLKVARRDFYYWLPLYGVGGFMASLGMRVAAKLVSDYTGLVQVRQELRAPHTRSSEYSHPALLADTPLCPADAPLVRARRNVLVDVNVSGARYFLRGCGCVRKQRGGGKRVGKASC